MTYPPPDVEGVPLDAPETKPRRFAMTDTGNAERLIATHGRNLRYVAPWKSWIIWDGSRWQRDETLMLDTLAQETVRAMWGEYNDSTGDYRERLGKHIPRSEAAPRLEAMVRRARSQRGVPITPAALDADVWKINVANGVLDLRASTPNEERLVPHRRDDLITKLVPIEYDPEARCDRWEAFLHKVLGGNCALISFLQRAVGYSLTGETAEQCLFFLYGSGSNGKSTFLDLLRDVAGEYATMADFTSFLEKRGEGPRNDIARLYGARVVTSSEVGEGKRLNESLVKTLTGGDVVTARYLYAEAFEFRPTFKLWLGANHRPLIRGTDYAIWRRIRLIPFTVQIGEDERIDRDVLLAQLRAELPGILAWAVAGCLLWQQSADGLGPPLEVTEATDKYRRESDTLGAFIEDCCEVGADYAERASDLFSTYKKWADEGSEFELSQTRFGREMEERGFVAEKRGWGNARVKWRLGIRLVLGETVPTVPFSRRQPEKRDSSGELSLSD